MPGIQLTAVLYIESMFILLLIIIIIINIILPVSLVLLWLPWQLVYIQLPAVASVYLLLLTGV